MQCAHLVSLLVFFFWSGLMMPVRMMATATAPGPSTPG